MAKTIKESQIMKDLKKLQNGKHENLENSEKLAENQNVQNQSMRP